VSAAPAADDPTSATALCGDALAGPTRVTMGVEVPDLPPVSVMRNLIVSTCPVPARLFPFGEVIDWPLALRTGARLSIATVKPELAVELPTTSKAVMESGSVPTAGDP